jgi:hypothetical protein
MADLDGLDDTAFLAAGWSFPAPAEVGDPNSRGDSR